MLRNTLQAVVVEFEVWWQRRHIPLSCMLPGIEEYSAALDSDAPGMALSEPYFYYSIDNPTLLGHALKPLHIMWLMQEDNMQRLH